jgi:hypothetical protein
MTIRLLNHYHQGKGSAHVVRVTARKAGRTVWAATACGEVSGGVMSAPYRGKRSRVTCAGCLAALGMQVHD